MTAPAPRRKGKGSVEIMEEAAALLRSAPPAVLVSYYLGTMPFILGLLYFWSDMSRSAFAQQRLAQSAFGMVLLYLWMKIWHTVFAVRLRAHLGGESAPVFAARRVIRILAQQTAWQPFGLFLLPASMIVFLPLGWVYAYLHNLSLTGDGEDEGVSACSKRAWKMAGLWPWQNHAVISLASLLWLLVFMNIGAVLYLLPELGRMLLGIDTVFTMSGASLFNTTFYAIVAGLTQLVMNPFLKAVYVLRCFYGESLHSGADLKAELHEIARPANSRGPAAAAIVALFLLLSASPARAEAELPAKALPAQGTRAVPAKDLNDAIDRVINKREYQWRQPRQEQVDSDRNAILEFFRGIRDWFVKVLQPLRDLWKRLRDWFRRIFKPETGGDAQGSRALTEDQLTFLLVLLTAAAVILGIFLWRVWRRKKEVPAVQAQPVAVVPDLKDENVVASQLPEEEWQALAADLMSRGELRLAMRALYMASLAFLGGRSLITIARYKSNRDYQRELVRRSRERETLHDAFSENVTLFERSWYGTHEVTPQALQTFDQNHDRIRNSAQE